VEELDTYKHKPRMEQPYYRIDGDALEFYVPDYQQVSIFMKNNTGDEIPIFEPRLFAKGLFRIRNAGTDAGRFIYRYGGKVVGE
jgi:hypothetical protein